MAKYVINQSSKSGKIITNVGDNQRIVINRTITDEEAQEIPEMPPIPPVPGSGQDIIRAVGRGAKVFVNGKRVQ